MSLFLTNSFVVETFCLIVFWGFSSLFGLQDNEVFPCVVVFLVAKLLYNCNVRPFVWVLGLGRNVIFWPAFKIFFCVRIPLIFWASILYICCPLFFLSVRLQKNLNVNIQINQLNLLNLIFIVNLDMKESSFRYKPYMRIPIKKGDSF